MSKTLNKEIWTVMVWVMLVITAGSFKTYSSSTTMTIVWVIYVTVMMTMTESVSKYSEKCIYNRTTKRIGQVHAHWRYSLVVFTTLTAMDRLTH